MKSKHYEYTTADKETGEVTTYFKSYTINTRADKFFMTFFENMASFFEIKSIIDVKVLAKLCSLADYNTGEVDISTAKRKEILELINIKTSQLSQSLARLKELDLINGEKGSYVINPAVFWKGDTKTREEMLKNNEISVNFNFKLE